MKSTRNAAVDIRDSGGSKLLLDLVTEEAWWWVSNQGVDNPLDSNVVESILASNASTTAKCALYWSPLPECRIGALNENV